MISTPIGMACTSILPRVAVSRRGLLVGRETDGRRGGRQQRIEHALFRGILCTVPDPGHGLFAGHLDGDVHEIADDAVDLAPDVTDLGELGCLDLHEGRLRQPRKAARNFRLAHACRADHEDVFGCNLAAQRLIHLHAAPAVPQRDRNGTLGFILSDDVLVQFLDNLAGGHL